MGSSSPSSARTPAGRAGSVRVRRDRLVVEQLETRTVMAVMIPAMMMRPTFTHGAAHPLATATATPPANTLTPAQMRAAYFVDAALAGAVAGDGAGQTIAIVDAFDLPTAASDMAAFSASFRLPAATFVKLN